MQHTVFADETKITGDGTEVHPLTGAPGFGVPAAPDKSVQFNDAGAFGGSNELSYDKAAHAFVSASAVDGSTWTLSAIGAASSGQLAAGSTGMLIVDMGASVADKIQITNSEPVTGQILVQTDSSDPASDIILRAKDSSNSTESNLVLSNQAALTLEVFDGTTGFDEVIRISESNGIVIASHATCPIGFYGINGVAKQTILGAKLPGDAVMAALLAALAAVGLITDGTT